MKKRIKVLIIMAFIPIIVFIAILTYINIRYSNISQDIRLIGVISDLIVNFEDEESLIKLSENIPSIPVKLNDEIQTEEIWIEEQDDEKLRLVIMKNSNISPENETAVIWLHGGGYAMKKPEDELILMQKFVERNNAVVISPDYTLSVEKPYPEALEDCYDTLLWGKNNAEELGINENQIFVGGGSAGGGLTAALSIYARDKQEVEIAFQMPLYPMINDKTIPNEKEEKETIVWDLSRNEIAWKMYLGEDYGKENISKYAVPLNEIDYTNLPPAHTFVGTEDPFYEDTLEYVNKLKKDGIETTYNIYNGAYHGFDLVAIDSKLSNAAWEELLKAYDYAVLNYFTN